MTPEVFQRIREDWKKSLPQVIAGNDTDSYPYGWAQADLPPANIRRTAYYIAFLLNVDPGDLLGKGRTTDLVRKRMLMYLLVRERFPRLSRVRLARALGRDHSTLCHGLARAGLRRDSDPTFRDDLTRLRGEM
jgi:chromosomal replication initiation ATPase DnaA